VARPQLAQMLALNMVVVVAVQLSCTFHQAHPPGYYWQSPVEAVVHIKVCQEV